MKLRNRTCEEPAHGENAHKSENCFATSVRDMGRERRENRKAQKKKRLKRQET